MACSKVEFSMTSVSFTVLGVAAPQGSHVRTKWGAMREDNPRTMPWRQEVAACAQKAMEGKALMLGPVRLGVQFVFPRPKGHYRTGKNAVGLRLGAPKHMTSKPDLSKLIRAIEDAMSGIVYRDDAQIVSYIDPHKCYTTSSVPGTTILVEEVP